MVTGVLIGVAVTADQRRSSVCPGVSPDETGVIYLTVAGMPRFDRVAATALAVVVAIVLMLFATGCSHDAPAQREGLPKDFPSSQVPLIDGHVISGDGTNDEWNVVVQAPANAGNPIDKAVRALTDAGYREDGRDSVGGQTVVRLSASKDGKTYWVSVGITSQAAAGGTSVFYHVST
ncbi:hypothetical protein EF294_17790 [Gordonia oryzae]|uniref:Uncharacterized protein n=2 Tax=Gordonia oryzae TaxID=2487349 RepID=A0A3N4GF08_9ACTN|nr:hypothetical protein EF294_17790 [Gordonia oryzae]